MLREKVFLQTGYVYVSKQADQNVSIMLFSLFISTMVWFHVYLVVFAAMDSFPKKIVIMIAMYPCFTGGEILSKGKRRILGLVVVNSKDESALEERCFENKPLQATNWNFILRIICLKPTGCGVIFNSWC